VRWVADKAFVVWSEKDIDMRPHMGWLLVNHPRFAELRTLPENLNRETLTPVTRSEIPRLWMLPNFHTLQEYLYGIPALKKLVEKRVGVDPSLDELAWALDQVVQEARAAAKERLELQKENVIVSKTKIEQELDAILGVIGGEVASDRYQAGRRKAELYKLSTIRDRRIIEKHAGSARRVRRRFSVTNYSLPTRAIR
jgi:hypothetical protein